jgi:hypothetical protein
VGWCPKSNDEKVAWYVGYIQLLQPALRSIQARDQDWAKSILASHFRALWSFAGCFDLLEQIIREHGLNGNWPEMWISIKQTLYFDGDNHAPELLARLHSLEKLTAPSDTHSQILAYVLVDIWGHIELRGDNFQAQAKEAYEKVIKLGELAASDPESLDRLGAKLWETHAQPLLWFGRGLAEGSADKFLMFDRLIKSFQKHGPEQPNLLLLNGFIRGIHDSDPGQARHVLEHVLGIREMEPHAISLLLAVPVEPWVSRRLLNLARSGKFEAWRFEQLGYGLAHESLPDGELAALLTEINALDRGYLSTIRIMAMRLFEKERHHHTPNEELCAVARRAVRQLVSAHRDELKQAQLHGIDRVLEEVFSTSVPEIEVREIIGLLCDGLRTYRLYAFELTSVIDALIKKYPELLLDAVFDDSEKERVHATLLFREHVSGDGPTLNDASLDRVLAWCGNDQERIKKVAKAVHSYCTSDPKDEPDENPRRTALGEHIKALLRAATDKLAIVEIIFEDIHPSSWSGSLADIFEVRSEAFAELLEYPDYDVQAFVKTKLPLLKQQIRVQRDSEASEHNEREQRFE